MSDMKIDIPSLILINGIQGCGKTHLIRYIMHKFRKVFSYGLVFSNTSFDTHNSGFDYIPREYQYPEFDEQAIINLMNIQAKLIEKNINKQAFIILDDCLFDPAQFTNPTLKKLCTQLRHYNITVIFSSQYCNAIPALIRSNAMSVFIFKSFTKRNSESLYESYGQAFENFQEFKNYLNENTGDYKFVFFNKYQITSDDPKDAYYVLKAPAKIPKFEIKYKTKK